MLVIYQAPYEGFKQCIIQCCKVSLHPKERSLEKYQKWRIGYLVSTRYSMLIG